MLGDILKDRKTTDKPRFFLHDEMKMWLKENLKIKIVPTARSEYSSILSSKLGIAAITFKLDIETNITIDNECLLQEIQSVDLDNTRTALEKLCSIVEACMVHINQMHAQINELTMECAQLKSQIQPLQNSLDHEKSPLS